MEIKEEILHKAKLARTASRKLGILSTEVKNNAILKMADDLEKGIARIVEANKEDQENAQKQKRTKAFIDRLFLNEERIKDIASGLREIAKLPDPVGEVVKMWKRPNGMQVGKIRVPLGVIGVIYESRPGVTADAAVLCLKSGNSIILRGGSEAINSNRAIAGILSNAAVSCGIPNGAIQIIEITDREAVTELLKLDKYIDIIIPRGGEELIRMVKENSTIPVIRHDKGLCHTYVDGEADLEMAEKICFNAKVQRPGVCNAMETLLVNKNIADRFLPSMIEKYKKAGVEIRGCKRTKEIVKNIEDAKEEDWNTEYLDLILSVKVVDSIDNAISHIAEYGSGHSEAIVTNNYSNAQKFLKEVDASSVFVNASTRLADGNQYGLGAEMGISTQKLHCRGPMGLEDLTVLKYIVYGDGQIRE
ncbi:MAG: glutamate-5-semialdehyde dehydrogenase [Candidatus Schekmanbacteria bacterium RBG_16_38_11]|uniref:Gamma-glutamyl phosphate reductase n=1 Tax=Candidatus Schekmanbacteria bacterium RBG_16_38_11 TaxID=1817880 RepID=A0A1F7RSQ3_9BACT|nr:MAG: glutamate-5-semialdehyde dehydrogenase [Candidatus Schekmanbacteria bacterium RBG_16_38_11]